MKANDFSHCWRGLSVARILCVRTGERSKSGQFLVASLVANLVAIPHVLDLD